MNNLDFSNRSDLVSLCNAVRSAHSYARKEAREDNATSYDQVQMFELEALTHEMDAKVHELSIKELSKKASLLEIATQDHRRTNIALARALRDVASRSYDDARTTWLTE